MPNNTLTRLEELLKKATPGPWSLDEHYQSYIWGPNSDMVADDGGDEEGTLTRMRGVGANLPLAINGQLIAELHNAAPALIAIARAAEAWRDAKQAVEMNQMCSEQWLANAEAALRSALAAVEGSK